MLNFQGGQMDINKRLEHDKLKKFQIFNAAQLIYIALHRSDRSC